MWRLHLQCLHLRSNITSSGEHSENNISIQETLHLVLKEMLLATFFIMVDHVSLMFLN